MPVNHVQFQQLPFLLNADASVDELSSCSLNYADCFAPGILIIGSLGHELVSWENLYSIHFAIIDNNLDLFQKFLRPTTNKLLTIQWFTPLHIACFFQSIFNNN